MQMRLKDSKKHVMDVERIIVTDEFVTLGNFSFWQKRNKIILDAACPSFFLFFCLAFLTEMPTGRGL